MKLKSDRFIWEACSAVGISILGSLFHFTYEWSGNNSGVAWFSAVNESVSEHMKLLVWPSVFFELAMFLTQRYTLQMNGQNILLARSIGLLVALIFLPSIFYLYTLSGAELLWVDIIIFLVSAFVISLVSWFMRNVINNNLTKIIGSFILLVVTVLFVVFSYAPPCDCGLWTIPKNDH